MVNYIDYIFLTVENCNIVKKYGCDIYHGKPTSKVFYEIVKSNRPIVFRGAALNWTATRCCVIF